MALKEASLDNRPSTLVKQQYIVGLSSEMRPVERLISEIAPTDIPVLLQGESGTGKEIVALRIHSLSRYRDLPFTKLSCAVLTPESLERRLNNSENGHAENNGNSASTLFLDEIGELDANCQRCLLHLIPDGSGVLAVQTLAGRIISSTTRDMESEVRDGRFRSELFYRLTGACLQLPPLRRRREDIPLLAKYFLSKYARIFQRKEMTLSDQVMQMLIEHPWPGNIRQLENVIKRVVALENEELGVAETRASLTVSRPGREIMESPSLKVASRTASRQAERRLILQTLEKTHWNRKRAAEALQISYKSLLFKLKQIQVPESDEV
jgi:two-component system, NtrC family, response regulator AtoC